MAQAEQHGNVTKLQVHPSGIVQQQLQRRVRRREMVARASNIILAQTWYLRIIDDPDSRESLQDGLFHHGFWYFVCHQFLIECSIYALYLEPPESKQGAFKRRLPRAARFFSQLAVSFCQTTKAVSCALRIMVSRLTQIGNCLKATLRLVIVWPFSQVPSSLPVFFIFS